MQTQDKWRFWGEVKGGQRKDNLIKNTIYHLFQGKANSILSKTFAQSEFIISFHQST